MYHIKQISLKKTILSYDENGLAQITGKRWIDQKELLKYLLEGLKDISITFIRAKKHKKGIHLIFKTKCYQISRQKT